MANRVVDYILRKYALLKYGDGINDQGRKFIKKKAFKADPDGQKKIKLFLKNFQNDIIEKKTGGYEFENTKYERTGNESP